MNDPGRFKCRWCNFTFLKTYHNKRGEACSGWPKIREHAFAEHYDELEELGATDEYLRDDDDDD